MKNKQKVYDGMHMDAKGRNWDNRRVWTIPEKGRENKIGDLKEVNQ